MGELDVATTPALRVGLLNMLLLYRSTVRSAAETLVLTLTKAPLEIIFPGRVIRAELRALVALGGPCSIAVFYQDFYGDGPGDTSSLSLRRSVARRASGYTVGSVVVTGGEDDNVCLGDYVDKPVLIVDPA